MNLQKYTKWLFSIIITIILSYGVIYAVTTTVSDGDILTSTLWNDLVNKIEPITNNNGTIELAGGLIRTIIHNTANGPVDQTDVGQIVTRVLNFNKIKDASKIRISYTDNFRTYPNAVSCRWEIKIDGASCLNQSLVYDVYNSGANPYHSRTFVGYCGGVTAGNHEIQVWVSGTPGYTAGDCYTGFAGSTWVIEAEEVN
ncbi:MAG: hypothetical protein QM490_00600 [Candidatus Gracilibacteria bacterium]